MRAFLLVLLGIHASSSLPIKFLGQILPCIYNSNVSYLDAHSTHSRTTISSVHPNDTNPLIAAINLLDQPINQPVTRKPRKFKTTFTPATFKQTVSILLESSQQFLSQSPLFRSSHVPFSLFMSVQMLDDILGSHIDATLEHFTASFLVPMTIIDIQLRSTYTLTLCALMSTVHLQVLEASPHPAYAGSMTFISEALDYSATSYTYWKRMVSMFEDAKGVLDAASASNKISFTKWFSELQTLPDFFAMSERGLDATQSFIKGAVQGKIDDDALREMRNVHNGWFTALQNVTMEMQVLFWAF